MRKLLNLIFLLPLAIILVLLSVANRQWIRFSLDPLNSETPAIAVELPLFVLLFICLILGVVTGGALTWFSQGKHRKALREKNYEANQLQRKQAKAEKTNANDKLQEIAPGLPLVTHQ